MGILAISYLVLAGGATAIFVYWLAKKLHHKYFIEALKLRLLLVQLPKKIAAETKEDPLKEINATAQLLSTLGNLKIPFSLEVAVHNIGEEIHFYVAVPKDSIEFTSRQIQGLWSDASVEEVEDYNVFNHQGVSLAVYLKQKEHFALPIRNYEEAAIDTFAPIISNLSKMQAIGEGAAMQIMIKPAPSKVKKAITSFIYQLKKGEKLSEVQSMSKYAISFKDIRRALKGTKPGEEKEAPKPIVEEETIKALERKIAKPLFAVNVRLIASAPSQYRAEEILNSLAGSFEQFQAPLKNSFRAIKPRNTKDLIFKYIFRHYNETERMVLGADELVSLFHFPIATTETPKIKWLKTRESAPPPNLPKEGTLLGESLFRGERKPIFISDEDRRRHIYITGQTGTGKTNAMLNIALNDILNGKGVAILDPHGDSIDDILGLIPQNRIEDVIVFNPGDIARPLGLNMLEYDLTHPEQKTFLADEMLGIIQKLFPESGEALGPIFQQYMRNTILLLLEDAPYETATLMDVPRLLTDTEYREKKLARCQNPVVKDFWQKEVAVISGESALSNMAPYITSKFNNFIANDYVRPIVSQPKSSFKFREIMDSGKILLVQLSKGRIGDINANLLGMIIVGKLLMAALSRVDIEQDQRKDFNLYIDEFHNFTTDSIAVILSEARKYRLNLVIAHQYISQLQEKNRDAVFGNVGSMIVFRVGPEDAEKLIKKFEPTFTKNDLVNIDNYNAYASLLINGQTSKPFNLKPLPMPRGNPELRERIKELSRTKYGLARGEPTQPLV